MFSKNKTYILFGIIGVLVLILSYQGCYYSGEIESQKEDFESAMSFKEKRSNISLAKMEDKANEVITLEQNLMSSENALKLLSDEFKDYKKVKSLVEFKLRSRVSNLKVGFSKEHDTVEVVKYLDQFDDCVPKDSVKNNFIKVPKSFTFKDKWLTIDGKTTMFGNTYDNLELRDELDVIVAYKKSGFLKKPDPVVEIKSYSPYSSIDYANNIVVKDDRRLAGKVFLSKPAMILYGAIGMLLIRK